MNGYEDSKEHTIGEYHCMLAEICAIIHYQSSLKEQDRWLANVIDKGVWNPDE